ncbi:MAG: helix-turn-helix domain-containing protein [Massiliimalia sp.]|jgi:transcriptional regulator with XRE-family HTH domain
MDLSKRLQALRKQHQLSQKKLAEELGVSRQAVSKWESGQATPDLEKLVILSQIYQVSMDYLVKGEENELQNDFQDQEKSSQETQELSFAEYRRRYAWHYEYRSKTCLFGIPLVHIHLGNGLQKAKGIIAVGNVAKGVISCGLCSVGILSFGLVSVGLFALGMLAAGILAAGGIAAGALFAAGGLAVSAYLAIGGLAVSSNVAIGGAAVGGHLAMGGYAMSHELAVGSQGSGEPFFKITSNGMLLGNKDALIQALEQLRHLPRWLKEMILLSIQ